MNLSGIGINKVFKTGVESSQPYYYVTGTLDLTNAVVGGTYFFNFDNDYSYAHDRDYYNFIIADDNSVISEVLTYVDSNFDVENPQSTWFAIGGADYKGVDNSVKVWWAAPPGWPYVSNVTNTIQSVTRNGSNVSTIVTNSKHGLLPGQLVNINCNILTFNASSVAVNIVDDYTFTYSNTGAIFPTTLAVGTVIKNAGSSYLGYPMNVSDLESSSVNYFGHSGGQYPYNKVSTNSPYTEDLSKRYKYLAVTILDELPDYPELFIDSVNVNNEDEVVIVQENKNLPTKRKLNSRNRNGQMPVGTKAVNSGRLTVTLKVYPKNNS